MLVKEVENALNQQIALEAHAAQSYLSMASWCEKEGTDGQRGFLLRAGR